MKNNLKYTKQCPDVHDFELALSGNHDFEFKLAFYDHLDHCDLCNTAYAGYRQMGLKQIKPLLNTELQFDVKESTRFSFKHVAYAATILILVGSFFLFKFIANEKQQNQRMIMANDILISEKYESNTPKKLMAKSEDSYWHIGENNELKLNDQVINLNDFDRLDLQGGNRAIVEVSNSNEGITNEIIFKLKEEKNQKVLTYSKHKELKRMSI